MKIEIPEISKQIYKEEILSIFEKKYSKFVPFWVNHQMEWMNGTYAAFKNHDKYLIIIFLIKKTLDFYSRNFTKISYDEFYLKEIIEIEKFTISEISIFLNIPKETTRRKVIELENEKIIQKIKEKFIIDRSKFFYHKPEKSIKRTARFLSSLSELCVNEKIISKKITSDELQKIIKNNFSYIWKMYYELQIPMMVGYKKFFKDLESFHIYGTCAVSQYLDSKNNSADHYADRIKYLDIFFSMSKTQGINAMSISEITGIPRATVIRKLQNLVRKKNILIDAKKHYRIARDFSRMLLPLQKNVFIKLADFSAQVFNQKY